MLLQGREPARFIVGLNAFLPLHKTSGQKMHGKSAQVVAGLRKFSPKRPFLLLAFIMGPIMTMPAMSKKCKASAKLSLVR
jgi:hypothetical protein